MSHVLIILLISFVFSSQATKPTRKNPQASMSCHPKALKRQDCRLKIGDFEVKLLSSSVAWFDGTWRNTEPMPLTGEGVEWEKVTLDLYDGWPVLQLWMWDKSRGEAKVQTLNWFVLSLDKQKLTPLAQGVVRRRRLQSPSEQGTPPRRPETLHLEKAEDHGLKNVGSHKLEWRLNRSRKIVERPKE